MGFGVRLWFSVSRLQDTFSSYPLLPSLASWIQTAQASLDLSWECPDRNSEPSNRLPTCLLSAHSVINTLPSTFLVVFWNYPVLGGCSLLKRSHDLLRSGGARRIVGAWALGQSSLPPLISTEGISPECQGKHFQITQGLGLYFPLLSAFLKSFTLAGLGHSLCLQKRA